MGDKIKNIAKKSSASHYHKKPIKYHGVIDYMVLKKARKFYVLETVFDFHFMHQSIIQCQKAMFILSFVE